jgi:hypothetical protein
LLDRIEKSRLLPGEDMPDSQVFVQRAEIQVGDEQFPAVTVRKYRRENTYPLGRIQDGKWAPDQGLSERIETMREGDLVEVDLEPEERGVLRMGMKYFVTAIAPYTFPKAGTIVSVTNGPPALVGLVADGEDSPAEYYYQGQAKLEPGQQIWYRPMLEGETNFMKFIWWRPIQFRVWTSLEGRKVEAAFVSEKDGIVSVRRKSDGKTFAVSLDGLSKEDRKWVADRSKKRP